MKVLLVRKQTVVTTVALLVVCTLFRIGHAATLLWDADADPEVTGYKVYVGQASGLYSMTTDVGNVISWTISGTVNGATNYLAVTAYNAMGLASDFSAEVSYLGAGTNQAPSISAIPNQLVLEDSSTATLPVTIGDAETSAGSLFLTCTSSNPALVPEGNITLAGSGSNRTVRITPGANQSGTATITLRVNDGLASTTSSFLVTVSPVNDPPVIADIPNQVINEDNRLGPIGFTIGDLETDATNLTVSANSSNPAIVSPNSILLGGSGSNRTVTITPGLNQSGVVTITLTVSDGALTASDSFVLTVNPVNDPPTLDSIANQTVSEDAGPQIVNLSGIGSGATNETQNLIVTAVSSDPTLIANPTINYTSPNATGILTFAPITNSNGTATITVTVNDNQVQNNTFSRSFTVTVSAINDPPTISDIGDQNTLAGRAVGPINFTVGDVEIAPAALTLIGTSSNPTLVPITNVVFGGSGSNRTVSVFPAAGQTGTATITVTVSDGALTASDSFVLNVQALNEPPSISTIDSQIAPSGTDVGPLSFTVGDFETAATNLILSATSSNAFLLPVENIVFGGSGSNRTVTLSPTRGAEGTTLITLAVSDGQLSASNSFLLAVTPALNTPPTISAISNQIIEAGVSVGPIRFDIGDLETPATNLSVSATTSNPSLIPSNNVVLGGAGSNRTVTLTPASGLTGDALITLVVSDGSLNAERAFTVTVNPSGVGTFVFSNNIGIAIPLVGAATPYPSTINVSGLQGVIAKLEVTLKGLSHTWPDDIDILLVGPAGQRMRLMSDIGGSIPVTNITLLLSDVGLTNLPDQGPLVSGTFKPTNIGSKDTFPSPAPSSPYNADLSAFAGLLGNGDWSLYVVDDGRGDKGSIQAWNLTIMTSTLPPTNAIPPQVGGDTDFPLVKVFSPDTNGCVVLQINGLTSQKYVIEASDDLITWTEIGVLGGDTDTYFFSDCAVANRNRRFFRVVETQ